MGLHTNCVQVKHVCVVLWTLTCELWMVQEPDELLCHGCSSFNSPNECQYPSFMFVKELNKHMNLFTSAVKLNLWTLSHIWIQLKVALQGSADVDGLSAAFLNQFAAWLNEFVYGPFGTCCLNLRASVLSIYSTMRRVQIMQTLAGNASFQTSIHFNCWLLKTDEKLFLRYHSATNIQLQFGEKIQF